MSALPKASKRRDVIKRFKDLGWSGPYKGNGKHPEYMQHPSGRTTKIPNEHGEDIREALLKRLLGQAAITVDEWLGKESQSDRAARDQDGPGTPDGECDSDTQAARDG